MTMAVIGAGKWELAIDGTSMEQSPLDFVDTVSSSAECSRDLSLACLYVAADLFRGAVV
jgi:hypothetical protein